MCEFHNLQDYKRYLRVFSKYKKPLKVPIDKDEFNKIITFIDRILYDRNSNYKILMLSLSGSRAAGWARVDSDYDIFGLFAKKDYWNYVFVKRSGIDLKLYELDFFFYYFPKYVSFFVFQNILASPIYIDSEFDYRELASFCKSSSMYPFSDKIHKSDLKLALHAYGKYLARIYFLRERKFSWDVFKINKHYYNFKMLTALKNKQIHHPNDTIFSQKELRLIRNDFKKLKHDLSVLQKESKGDTVDMDQFRNWEQQAKEMYWDNL